MYLTSNGQVRTWRVRDREIPLDQFVLAGILNVTPDSFSDGGQFFQPDVAIAHAHEMVAEGANLIDIGAESTRPGSEKVNVEEEWDRLEPVLRGLRDLTVPISIDTTKLEVAERAIDAGADAINDVTGLQSDPRVADLAARTGAGLVIMHMRGTPQTMQNDTWYEDVVKEVCRNLEKARDAAIGAGCHPDQIAVDPGLGFGKSVEGNLELIARLDELSDLGAPVWIGPSRKSFLGDILGVGPDDRLSGTVAACLAALEKGANVLRVHDVREIRDALKVHVAIAQMYREKSKVDTTELTEASN
jgi:dihydropteroate synthase